jgi:hypothetical protein
LEHDGRQQSQNRDAQPWVPEDVEAVHCAPEDDPDDDPLELEVLDPPELLDPPDEVLDPAEPLDPDEVLELLEKPLELAEEPLDAPDPLLEAPLAPLLLPTPPLECPESERPPSDVPELSREPLSALSPASSPGLSEPDVAHPEAMPALNPRRRTTRMIRGMSDMVLARTGGNAPKERRPSPLAKAHVLAG